MSYSVRITRDPGLHGRTLDAANSDGSGSLLEKRMLEDGAMAASNKQRVFGLSAGKRIQVVDRRVGVNGTPTAAAMLEECRERRLLKFMVVRGAS